MYPNFNAERARADITLEDIARETNSTVASVSNKLNGIYRLTFDDAVKYKAIVKTDVPLEKLFEKRGETSE